MVTVEYCRLHVSDTELTRFLAPKLIRKGIRDLEIRFDRDLIHLSLAYPLNRFGFQDLSASVSVSLNNFNSRTQIIELCVTDFDLRDAEESGFFGKVLGHAVGMAKRLTGAEIVKWALERLRGRLAFLDVDAPGLMLRIRMKTLSTLLSPYVLNLNPDEFILAPGTLTLVQKAKKDGSPKPPLQDDAKASGKERSG